MILMSTNKVVYAGRTIIDLSNDSVTPSSLQEGKQAHDKAGNTIIGNAKILSSTMLVFTDITIQPADFVPDSTYDDFPYAAFIELPNVRDTYQPDVVFSSTTVGNDLLSNKAKSGNGGVYIYAADIPEESLNIPTILCWDTTFRMEYEDILISSNSLSEGPNGYYSDVHLEGVTATMFPVVAFEEHNLLIDPVAETFDGGIRLYFNGLPSEDLTIQSIVFYNIDN